jgi:hypothetical protein
MSPPVTSVFGIEPGDHAWIRYAGEDERRALWAAHVTAAVERGERAVFIGTGTRAACSGGDALRDPRGDGQVSLRTPAEAGFAGGRLDSARLARMLEEQVAEAARLGLRGLRVCVDLAQALPDLARPAGRGARGCPLAVVLTWSRPPAVICHGDRRRFPEERFRVLAERHAPVLEARPPPARHPLLYITPVSGPPGLSLAGEIDGSNLGVLAMALETAPLDGRDLRLHMRGLRHADVGAVRLLVRAAEAMPDGHRLVLHSPGPVVRAILRHFAWENRLVVEEGDRR